jgi:CHAD domain-containing protein/CYTH domain-containing protein
VARSFEANELLDEPAVVAVRRIALALTERAEECWRVLAGMDPTERGEGGEELHDFRVTLRSLRSWLRAHQDVLRVSRKVRRRLRRAARATNASRDAEVLAELLVGLRGMNRAGAAASRWWRDRLAERAHDPVTLDEVGHDVERAFRALERRLAVVTWSQPVEEPWSFSPLATDLAARVRVHRDRFVEALEQIDYADRELTVHAARIAAKRVRYLLEPVKADVPEVRAAVKLLKALQDDFGELHDLHVARHELDRGVVERAAHEATERTREVLDAADEGRIPRRQLSRLGGFASIATAVRDEEQARFKAITNGWLSDDAAQVQVAIDRAIRALARRGGRGRELEHKYLLSAPPTIPGDCIVNVVSIEQGYLPGDQITERLRRQRYRDETTKLTRTIKSGHGLTRTEIEEDVTSELFNLLWPLTAPRRIYKQRTKATLGDLLLEVDVFLDRALVIAEIEVERADDPIQLPQWILDVLVAEVTDDPTYTNANLASPGHNTQAQSQATSEPAPDRAERTTGVRPTAAEPAESS